MNIDNKAFIARHHKTVKAGLSQDYHAPVKGRGAGWISTAFVCAVMAVIIAAFFYFGYDLTVISGDPVILAAAFSFSLWVGFSFGRIIALTRRRAANLDLFGAVLEGSRAARMITNENDRAVYTNQKFAHMCRGVGPPGYRSLLRLFRGNDEALAHIRMLGDKAGRGLTDSIELFSKYEDQERWLLVTAQPVLGYPDYIHWRVDDVTAKYTVDQAIREEREQLIDFTDNAPVGFFSVNETGRFIFANATFARWLGEDLQALLDHGHLHTYLMKPPVHGAPYDVTDKAGARQVVEVFMKGPAGQTFLASVNQVVVDEGNGHVTTRAVVHDLTAEQEMRAALQESQARFQRFFEEAPLGIVMVDEAGVIEQCNPAFAGMLGKAIDKIEGQPLKAFSAINVDAAFKTSQEVELKGMSGPIIAQLHASRLRESGNIILHFIDMTEQKELEEQFVQSQKMQAIGQLAGGVAHDFNNLLTAIIGFCDLLLLRHKPGDPSFADIMQIKQNSNRAANLVRQLLAFSRQQTLRPKIWDITDILTEVSHLLRRLIGASIDLDLVHGPDLWLVKVDEGQMEQVLINLAVNARDAMDGKGALVIKTENYKSRKVQELISEELPPGEWIKIHVQDTGCGIPSENLSRIFEPFFTTKDVGQGTGLGLATVYGIIRQTGGFLDVQSEVDLGTGFTIYLPRVSEAEEQDHTDDVPDEDSIVKDLTGTERILLVEDEDAVRTFSQRALSNKGYEVLAADSGETALSIFEKDESKQFDLLITDVVMPGMDGPALAQRVRQTSSNLKIIFMSGYTEDKLKDYMGKNTWFLPKPFTLKQLAAKVKDVLAE